MDELADSSDVVSQQFDSRDEAEAFEEALKKMESSQPSTVAWSTELSIGNDFPIKVTGYIKTTAHKKRNWFKTYVEKGASDTQKSSSKADEDDRSFDGDKDNKDEDEEKSSQKGESIAISRQINYMTKEKTKVDTRPDEITKGYLFGKTIVPITAEDEEAMKYQNGSPGVRVLFFTDACNYRIFFLTGSKSMVFVSDVKAKDTAPEAAFNALVTAMIDTKRLAIVTMIRTARSSPQVGVLTPCYMDGNLVLVYNQLPFAEDIRYYQFPPLVDKRKQDNVPSFKEMDLIDDLIDRMNLVEYENGKMVKEYLRCEEIRDPYDRIQFKAIRYRRANPGKPLPKEILIDDTLTTPSHILKKSEPIIEDIKILFNLIETQKRPASPNSVKTKAEEVEVEPKKVKLESESQESTIAFDDDDVCVIDSENEATFETEMQKQIIEGLKKHGKEIDTLTKDLLGFNDGKILNFVKDYRKECLSASQGVIFNQFFTDLKARISHRSSWKMIVRNGLTLITSFECKSSEVTQDEAKKFIQ